MKRDQGKTSKNTNMKGDKGETSGDRDSADPTERKRRHGFHGPGQDEGSGDKGSTHGQGFPGPGRSHSGEGRLKGRLAETKLHRPGQGHAHEGRQRGDDETLISILWSHAILKFRLLTNHPEPSNVGADSKAQDSSRGGSFKQCLGVARESRRLASELFFECFGALSFSCAHSSPKPSLVQDEQGCGTTQSVTLASSRFYNTIRRYNLTYPVCEVSHCKQVDFIQVVLTVEGCVPLMAWPISGGGDEPGLVLQKHFTALHDVKQYCFSKAALLGCGGTSSFLRFRMGRWRGWPCPEGAPAFPACREV